MKLQQVTIKDGQMLAQLINLLRAGRWDLSGKDVNAYSETFSWVQSMAAQMADLLKTDSSPSPTTGFKVKAAGPLPSAPVSTGKSNRKKQQK